MKDPFLSGGIFSELDAMQRRLDPLRDILKPLQGLDATTPQLVRVGVMDSLFEKMRGPLDDIERIVGPLRREQVFWENLIAPLDKLTASHAPALEAALSWGTGVESLLGKFDSVGLFDKHDDLVARLLAPASAFTLAAESLQNITDQPALLGLEFLSEHWTKSATILESFVTLPEDDDEPGEPRPLELLRHHEDKETSAFEEEIATRARMVLTLAHRCNTAAQLNGGPPIFKQTTRILEVFTDLPWLRADSQSSLGDVVDCLYFLLYEGAGKDKLRFMPTLSDQECDLIWKIKHLRNKWLRHDLEHGSEKEIAKAYSGLASALKWAGLENAPTSARQFMAVQQRLLLEAERFLGTLLGRLQAGQP